MRAVALADLLGKGARLVGLVRQATPVGAERIQLRAGAGVVAYDVLEGKRLSGERLAFTLRAVAGRTGGTGSHPRAQRTRVERVARGGAGQDGQAPARVESEPAVAQRASNSITQSALQPA